jgi:MFS family permease
MASNVQRVDGATVTQGWPSAKIAYYSVFVLIVSSTMAQLDVAIVPFLASSIKRDLHLSDTSLGLLLGVSFGLFYTLVGIPIAWFSDRYSRKWIVALGTATFSIGTALCGLAQSFAGLFMARFVVGAGEGVGGPAGYSLVGDLFPRERLPRASALLMIGSILGPALGLLTSAYLLNRFLPMGPVATPFGVIRGWQVIFIIVGLPGLLVSLLVALTLKDPARRVIPNQIQGEPMRRRWWGPFVALQDYGIAISYMRLHWRVFAPLFGALIIVSFAGGTMQWMPIFYERTFGWGPARVAGLMGASAVIVMPIGLVVGVIVAERFAKTRDDAAMRVNLIGRLLMLPTVFSVLMPNPWLAFALGLFGQFGLGFFTPSQNAAMLTVVPAEHRGKVSALYWFVYSVMGVALAPLITSLFTDYVFRDESRIGWAIFIPSAIFVPLSLIVVSTGVKPFGREVKRLRELEAAARI